MRELLLRVGYLMRTTAVYGNGKFGLADRDRIADRAGARRSVPRRDADRLSDPLLHARSRRASGGAAGGEPAVSSSRHCAGALRHRQCDRARHGALPRPPSGLIDRWVTARETALARARADRACRRARIAAFSESSASHDRRNWLTDDSRQLRRDRAAARGSGAARRPLRRRGARARDRPSDALPLRRERFSLEAQEYAVTLLLEPHGGARRRPREQMGTTRAQLSASTAGCAAASCADLRRHYAWALALDFSERAAQARFWYVSEEKLEPRLGERFEEPGAELELPLAMAVTSSARSAMAEPGAESVAEFLLRLPEHRSIVRRVQTSPASLWRGVGNLIAADCLPSTFCVASCRSLVLPNSIPSPIAGRKSRSIKVRHSRTKLDPPGAADWCYPALEPSASVRLSLNEVEVTTRKAALGAGFPLGLARGGGCLRSLACRRSFPV